MKVTILVATVIGIASAASSAQTPAASRPGSAAELRAAAKDVKRATLNDLAALRLSPNPDQTSGMISVGLEDSDADIRLCAVWAAAGRASASRFVTSPAAGAVGAAERPYLNRLREPLVQTLADPDERVRRAAVIALVNLEYDPGRAPDDVLLKPDVATALARQLSREDSPRVRAEIVKSFALTAVGSQGRDTLLTRALDDSDEDVVHFAVVGIARSTPSDALDRVVELLNHPSRNVRLQSAQAIGAFGPAAQGYLNQLIAAAASERDDAVKKTLDAVVAQIRHGRQ